VASSAAARGSLLPDPDQDTLTVLPGALCAHDEERWHDGHTPGTESLYCTAKTQLEREDGVRKTSQDYFVHVARDPESLQMLQGWKEVINCQNMLL